MKIRSVHLPLAGQQVLYAAPKPGEQLILYFPATTVRAMKVGDHLVLTHPNGARITVQDFFKPPVEEADNAEPPQLVIDNRPYLPQEFLRHLGEERLPQPGITGLADQELQDVAPLSRLEGLTALKGLDLVNDNGSANATQHDSGAERPDVTSEGPPMAQVQQVPPLQQAPPVTPAVPPSQSDQGLQPPPAPPVTPSPETPASPPPSVQDAAHTLIEDGAVSTAQGNALIGATTGTGPAVLLWSALSSSSPYGTFTPQADGSYTYALNNNAQRVQALGAGEEVYEDYTFSYTDSRGQQAVGHVRITIVGTNDAPTVSAAEASLPGDAASLHGQLPASIDPDRTDHPMFVPQNDSQGQYGSLTLQADGSYVYKPYANEATVRPLSADQQITDTFTYTVSDGHGGTATNTLTVAIHGVNDAPTVTASTGAIFEDAASLSGTLALPHDVDATDQPVFITQANTPGQYGSLTLHEDGSYTYTLNNASPAVQALGQGQQLTDAMSYTVSDGHGGTATNTLTVTIHGTNDAPTVAASTGAIFEDAASLSGTLALPHDMDANDSPLFVQQSATAGHYGAFTLNADGTYTYTLNNSLSAVQALSVGESLTDTFTVQAADQHGGTATNTLTVTIHGSNDAPTVAAAIQSLSEDADTTLGTLPRPQDVDAHDSFAYSVQTGTPGTYGTLSVAADGTYTYNLNTALAAVQRMVPGDSLTETFAYTVNDNHGGSASNVLTLTINGASDRPTVAELSADLVEDTSLVATGILPVPASVDRDVSAAFAVQPPIEGSFGTLTVDTLGTYIYTLNNTLPAVQALSVGDTLTDTLTYALTASNGLAGTGKVMITIHGTNDAPTLAATALGLSEDTSVTTGTLPAAVDVDAHDSHFYTAQTGTPGTYGTLSVDAAGHYTYTLNTTLAEVQQMIPGEHLTETFTYTVNDNHGASASNVLTITINGANDAPTVAATSGAVTEDTALTISGALPMPTDADHGVSAFFVPQTAISGSYGTLSVDAFGHYTYTLNNTLPAVQGLGAGETLTDTVAYPLLATNGVSGTGLLHVTINGVNDAPVPTITAAQTAEDASTLRGSLNMSDPDNTLDGIVSDILTVTPQTGVVGSYGTLDVQADGSFAYTLKPSLPVVQALGVGEQLTESFAYTVNDGHGASSLNTLVLTINGTNDNPTVTAASTSVQEDLQTIASGILPAPTDVDSHDSPNFIPQTATPGLYGTLTLNADGSYTYTLDNNRPVIQGLGQGEHLTETFTYTVSDGHGGFGANTLTVTINGTNDNPTVAAASAAVQETLRPDASGTLPTPTDVDNTADGVVSNTLSFVPQTLSGHYGQLHVDAQGHYSYSLNAALPDVQALGEGQSATDTFTYTVIDNAGGTGTNTLTIAITGTNNAPIAHPAADQVTEDSTLVTSGHLPAPTDVDNADVVVFVPKLAEPGLYGSLMLDADGSYVYTLNNPIKAVQGLGEGETLSESFLYTVVDSHNAVSTNTLTVTIHGANDLPVAHAATASVTEDSALTAVGALPLPQDADRHDTVSFLPQTDTQGHFGVLNLHADGTYTYALNNTLPEVQGLSTGERLTETFTYEAADNHGGITHSTLTVTVNGTNDPPVLGLSEGEVQKDALTVLNGVLSTPTDPDNTIDGVLSDTLHFVPIVNAMGSYGTLDVRADGTYTYTLDNSRPTVQQLGEGQSVNEIFTVTVQDDHGGVAQNLLTIAVHGRETVPGEPAGGSGGENGGATPPPDGSQSVYDFVDSVQEDGRTAFTGSLRPAADVDIRTDTVLDVVTPQQTTGTYGTFTLDPSGTYTYVLHNGSQAVQSLSEEQTVSETFTYTIQNEGVPVQGHVTVNILGANDAPSLSATTASLTEDAALSISGVFQAPVDIDAADSPHLVPQVNTDGAFGSLTLDAAGHYTYTLHADQSAVQGLGEGESLTDTFMVQAEDGHGGTAQSQLTVTLHGVNDAPVVDAATASVIEDLQQHVSGFLPTPTDADVNDIPRFDPQSNADGHYGVFSLSPTGAYTYILNNAHDAVQALGQGEHLDETFTYTVTDGHGGSTQNTITITIHGTNDLPSVEAATGSLNDVEPAHGQPEPALSGVLPTPHDIDVHDTLTFTPLTSHEGSYGALSVHEDGSYTYTLHNDLASVRELPVGTSVTDSFTYTVTDGHGGTAQNTLTLTIHAANDAPTLEAATGSTTPDALSALSGLLPPPHDADLNDLASFVPQTQQAGQYGALSVDAEGHYSYALDHANTAVENLAPGHQLTDTFAVTVTDSHGAEGHNTLTITIDGGALLEPPNASLDSLLGAAPAAMSTSAAIMETPAAPSESQTLEQSVQQEVIKHSSS